MNGAGDPRTRESKTFRLDLVIAICALFVSSLATAASWWQSRVVATQLSSQVWPYLSVQTSYDGSSVALTISNEGLGPARVRSVVLSLDGKPRQTLTDVLDVIAPAKRRNLRGQFTDIAPGSVIRVGGTVSLFRIGDRTATAALVRNYKRMDLAVCYCPIIPGDCWMVRRGGSDTDAADPQTVADCPDQRRFMYRSGVAP
ncbi:MAG TPA: hypothetical protein VE826_02970 [Dongiaceae bacterium]|nr:hypothetical protein [Dongiaceae bacterium]